MRSLKPQGCLMSQSQVRTVRPLLISRKSGTVSGTSNRTILICSINLAYYIETNQVLALAGWLISRAHGIKVMG
jgi:hypothetical protein